MLFGKDPFGEIPGFGGGGAVPQPERRALPVNFGQLAVGDNLLEYTLRLRRLVYPILQVSGREMAELKLDGYSV